MTKLRKATTGKRNNSHVRLCHLLPQTSIMILTENFSRPTTSEVGGGNWRWTCDLPTSLRIFMGSPLQSYPTGILGSSRRELKHLVWTGNRKWVHWSQQLSRGSWQPLCAAISGQASAEGLARTIARTGAQEGPNPWPDFPLSPRDHVEPSLDLETTKTLSVMVLCSPNSSPNQEAVAGQQYSSSLTFKFQCSK